MWRDNPEIVKELYRLMNFELRDVADRTSNSFLLIEKRRGRGKPIVTFVRTFSSDKSLDEGTINDFAGQASRMMSKGKAMHSLKLFLLI